MCAGARVLQLQGAYDCGGCNTAPGGAADGRPPSCLHRSCSAPGRRSGPAPQAPRARAQPKPGGGATAAVALATAAVATALLLAALLLAACQAGLTLIKGAERAEEPARGRRLAAPAPAGGAVTAWQPADDGSQVGRPSCAALRGPARGDPPSLPHVRPPTCSARGRGAALRAAPCAVACARAWHGALRRRSKQVRPSPAAAVQGCRAPLQSAYLYDRAVAGARGARDWLAARAPRRANGPSGAPTCHISAAGLPQASPIVAAPWMLWEHDPATPAPPAASPADQGPQHGVRPSGSAPEAAAVLAGPAHGPEANGPHGAIGRPRPSPARRTHDAPDPPAAAEHAPSRGAPHAAALPAAPNKVLAAAPAAAQPQEGPCPAGPTPARAPAIPAPRQAPPPTPARSGAALLLAGAAQALAGYSLLRLASAQVSRLAGQAQAGVPGPVAYDCLRAVCLALCRGRARAASSLWCRPALRALPAGGRGARRSGADTRRGWTLLAGPGAGFEEPLRGAPRGACGRRFSACSRLTRRCVRMQGSWPCRAPGR